MNTRFSPFIITGVFFLTSLFTYVNAQKPLYTNQQWFKVEDGLPQSFVSDIVQDEDGFIWISTFDGLARYDGRSFRRFNHPQDKQSLHSSNVIYNIIPSPGNLFWIKYQTARPEIFDPRRMSYTGKTEFISEESDVFNKVFLENHARYWSFIADKGIGWIDPFTQKKWFASTQNHLLKDDSIIGVAQKKDGSLLLLSRNSIQISDSSRSHFKQLILPKALPVEILQIIRPQITLLDDERLVIASNEAIYILHIKTGEVKKISAIIGKIGETGPRTFRRGPGNKLYIKGHDRVYRLEYDEQLTLIWQHLSPTPSRITSILIDNTESLWVGIDGMGLAKINLRSMPLNAVPYQNSFHVDVLSKMNISQSSMPSAWLNDKWSYSFRYLYDGAGNLYLTHAKTSEEKGKPYVVRNNRLVPLLMPVEDTMVMRGITMNEKGELFILDAFHRGICYWTNETARPVFLNKNIFPEKEGFLNDLVYADNYLWATSGKNGLYQLTTDGKQIHNHIQSHNQTVPFDLTRIYRDPLSPQILWMGSLGGGLIQWHTQKGLLRIFTTNDGLPNNTIYSIVADKSKKLWISTNKGICRFNPQSYEVQIFQKSDGLPGNEFNRFHEFMFPDGNIAFGGIDGMTVFTPSDFALRVDSVSASIQLTDIAINNKMILPGDSTEFIKTPLSQLTEIILPYNKNYLTFYFAALQFNEPHKIKYRYRLKGLNDEWVESGFNNAAYYTGLKHGTYELEIMCTKVNGQWGSNIRRLKVVIRPPLWATWWAYSIYAALVIYLIWAYWHYREKRIKNKQQLIFEQKEAQRLREMDTLKTNFFSNITHEFRTPLTLISAPLEKLKQNLAMDEQAQQYIQTAGRNADKLLRLINQLLDLSKLEAGQLKVNLSAGEFSVFIQECLQPFANAAAEKQIKFNSSIHNLSGLYSFDKEKWEKIISNLTGNALKFTPKHGSISIDVTGDDNNETVIFKIKDSGPGIRKELQEKIFERFFQAENSHSVEGTGIGLSLVKELCQLMHGSIKVESNTNEGALFTVTIPVKKSQEQISSNIPAQPLASGSSIPLTNTEEDKQLPVVLVAEDNPELLAFITNLLSSKYKVITAPDGIIAREKATTEIPDIIISDVMMPGRDGIELCDICKNDPATSHIGFILLTSRMANEVRLAALKKGADNYIPKPFNPEELELAVQNLVSHQEKMRQYLQEQLLPLKPEVAPQPVEDPFLKEAYEVVEQYLNDSQLNVELLASKLALSKSSLNRKLKTLLNITPNELIRRYRLQKATGLLLKGEDITSVAYQTGFSSPSYFTQCFKDQYNTTPSEFIAVHKLNQN